MLVVADAVSGDSDVVYMWKSDPLCSAYSHSVYTQKARQNEIQAEDYTRTELDRHRHTHALIH